MNKNHKVIYQNTDKGVVPIYCDEITTQPISYSTQDHNVWATLLSQHMNICAPQACDLYQEGLEEMGWKEQEIPQFSDINSKLRTLTGWNIVPVNGLISNSTFFKMLSLKEFPVSWWIRSPENLNYIAEPDLFHDLVGHIPMFCHTSYSQMIQLFGKVGMRYLEHPDMIEKISRLYWYTVEFGLSQEKSQKISVFGAGIVSSLSETKHALETTDKHIVFQPETILHSHYQIDRFQDRYFILPSIEAVLDTLHSKPFST